MKSSLSSPRPLSLLTGGALVLTLVAGTANGAILFQDNFSGLGTNPLNGTTPDVTQGTTAWVGDTEYKADGTGTATAGTNPSIRAYLTLGGLIDDNRGNANALYTLSATVNVAFNATVTLWHGFGFWDEDAPSENFASAPSDGTAWILRRANTDLQTFLGPRTANGLTETGLSPDDVAGTVDLQIVLDLTDWNGTTNWGSVEYYGKLTSDSTYNLIANGELNATNSTFRAVGIGGGSQTVTSTLSSFPRFPSRVRWRWWLWAEGSLRAVAGSKPLIYPTPPFGRFAALWTQRAAWTHRSSLTRFPGSNPGDNSLRPKLKRATA